MIRGTTFRKGSGCGFYWWNEVREQTPELFAGLYEEWKALRDEGKTEEAAKKLESIKNLGLDALPLGDGGGGERAIRTWSRWRPIWRMCPWITGEKASDAMTCDECVAWWDAGKAHYAMPPFEKIVVVRKGRLGRHHRRGPIGDTGPRTSGSELWRARSPWKRISAWKRRSP